MKETLLKIFFVALVVFLPGFASATATTTPTVGDTYIRQQNPTTNYDGGANSIYVGYRSCCEDNMLQKFVLPSLTGTITDVKLFVKTHSSSGTAVPADIYGTASFNEGTVTWNTVGTLGSLLGTINLSATTDAWSAGSIGSSYSWGDTIYLRIKASAGTPNSDWWETGQKDGSFPSYSAYLEITYTPPEPPPGAGFNLASSVLFTLASTTATSTEYYLTPNGKLLTDSLKFMLGTSSTPLYLQNDGQTLFNGFVILIVGAFIIVWLIYKHK